MSKIDQSMLKQMLLDGLNEMTLDLSEAQVDQMITYLGLLFKWNSVYNLTSVRDPKEMVSLHLLDSLSAAHAFKDAKMFWMSVREVVCQE